MYCEGTVGILDENDCRAATHVFIYTHTPSAADSLRPRDGTQCWRGLDVVTSAEISLSRRTNHAVCIFLYEYLWWQCRWAAVTFLRLIEIWTNCVTTVMMSIIRMLHLRTPWFSSLHYTLHSLCIWWYNFEPLNFYNVRQHSASIGWMFRLCCVT